MDIIPFVGNAVLSVPSENLTSMGKFSASRFRLTPDGRDSLSKRYGILHLKTLIPVIVPQVRHIKTSRGTVGPAAVRLPESRMAPISWGCILPSAA